MSNRLVKAITNPKGTIDAISRKIRHSKLDREIFTSIFNDQSELESYHDELANSGLLDVLEYRIKEFDTNSARTLSGEKPGTGIISNDEGIALYAIMRKLKPEHVVETGVCNGYSSALILKALETNQAGKLHSIDFPEVIGETYSEDVFWQGKGSAAVPEGRESGWIIPDDLKARWELHLGKTQDLLAPLLEKLGSIDIFIHDSEHSYECMWYEYSTAWKHIKDNGFLISDDIGWNSAFFDFAKQVSRTTGHIAGNMGIIKKHP